MYVQRTQSLNIHIDEAEQPASGTNWNHVTDRLRDMFRPNAARNGEQRQNILQSLARQFAALPSDEDSFANRSPVQSSTPMISTPKSGISGRTSHLTLPRISAIPRTPLRPIPSLANVSTGRQNNSKRKSTSTPSVTAKKIKTGKSPRFPLHLVANMESPFNSPFTPNKIEEINKQQKSLYLAYQSHLRKSQLLESSPLTTKIVRVDSSSASTEHFQQETKLPSVEDFFHIYENDDDEEEVARKMPHSQKSSIMVDAATFVGTTSCKKAAKRAAVSIVADYSSSSDDDYDGHNQSNHQLTVANSPMHDGVEEEEEEDHHSLMSPASGSSHSDDEKEDEGEDNLRPVSPASISSHSDSHLDEDEDNLRPASPASISSHSDDHSDEEEEEDHHSPMSPASGSSHSDDEKEDEDNLRPASPASISSLISDDLSGEEEEEEDHHHHHHHTPMSPEGASVHSDEEDSELEEEKEEEVPRRPKHSQGSLKRRIQKHLDENSLIIRPSNTTFECRRSKRNRVRPVNYWAGERPLYQRTLTKDGNCVSTLVGVASVKRIEPTRIGHYKKRAPAKGKKNKQAEVATLKMENILDLSIHKKKFAKAEPPAPGDPEHIRAFAELEFTESTTSQGVFTAMISKQEGTALGKLKFDPRAKKVQTKTGAYVTHFNVTYGTLLFKLGKDKTGVVIKSGFYVKVDGGTTYSIENLRNDQAIVEFTIIQSKSDKH